MGILDRFLEKRLTSAKVDITKRVVSDLTSHIDSQLTKANTGTSPFMTGSLGGSGTKRYQFTQDMINGGIQRRKKPGSNIAFETLRAFSISHEVTRACINFRKRQITSMEWNVVTSEPDDTKNYDAQIKEVKDFFKSVGGRGVGYRRFMDKFIEDLLVLDAVAIEKQRARNNNLYNLIPIDGATIRIRVDESGATPEPPETAYVQIIRGEVTAEFTDDEMIYEMMNPRNDTPYGLAPLESLMIIVSSSLKAGMYNLGYLTDGNIPEGLFTLPDSWQPNQIKEFQEYWDALMAGDETMTRRLKFMPEGKYEPTKKPEDMAFQEFNDWLMKITCALFEVQPQDIGFHPKTGLGGSGFAKQQGVISDQKGTSQTALFIEEVFTKIIQQEFGYDFLRFDFPSLREKDARSTAEVNEILIRSGQRTVNELRTDEGLDKIEGLDKPFYAGSVTFLDQESQDATAAAAQAAAEAPTVVASDEKDDPKEGSEKFDVVLNLRKNQVEELKTFRKYAVNRVKANKAIRPFVSSVLPLEMVEELNAAVVKADGVPELRKAFEQPIKELEMLTVDTLIQERGRAFEYELI